MCVRLASARSLTALTSRSATAAVRTIVVLNAPSLKTGGDHGDEQTCIDCRLELASDENLLALALEMLGMTREALVAEFEAQARRINDRE